MVYRTGDNNFGTAKWIVDPVAGQGTHTTIASALTSASSGEDIFIRPGTYTENLTLKAGVNLIASVGDSGLTPFSGANTLNVSIVGNCTASFAGSCNISNIALQTNAANLLTISGASATQVILNNCFLNATNNSAVSFTSNGGSTLFLNGCFGNLGTTGIAYFVATSGSITGFDCIFKNMGSSTTASTFSNANLSLQNSTFVSVVSTTNSSTITTFSCSVGISNTAFCDLTGTSSYSDSNSTITSGTASCITVGSGCTANCYQTILSSSNTNAITGAGTLNYSGLTFIGTSIITNVTTQTGKLFNGNIEGTFTPTLVGASVAGTTTYVNQNGYYTRVGSIVFVTANINITAATGTGAVSLGNLPFTIRSQTAGFVNGTIFWNGGASWTWPVGATSVSVLGTTNTNVLNVWAGGTAVTGGFISMANAALQVTYSIVYQI